MRERGSVQTYHHKYRYQRTGEWVTLKTVSYRFTHDRKAAYRGHGYKTAAEAMKAGKEHLARLMAGEVDKPGSVTFETIMTRLYGEERDAEGKLVRVTGAYALSRKPNTIMTVRCVVARLRKYMGNLVHAWTDITNERLKDYVSMRRAMKASESTITAELTFLKRGQKLLADDVQERTRGRAGLYVPKYPLDELQPNVSTDRYMPGEFERLIRYLRDDCVNVAIVARYTGWRMRSELLTRKWSHVDFGPDNWICEDCQVKRTEDACPCGMPRPGGITLEQYEGKNGQPRFAPLAPKTREALVAQRAYVDTLQVKFGKIIPWVFPSSATGNSMVHINGPWGAAVKEAKLVGKDGKDVQGRKKTIHALRRTAINEWVGAGVPEKDGMAMSGHTDPRTYRRVYQNTDRTSVRMAVRKVVRAHGDNVVAFDRKEQA